MTHTGEVSLFEAVDRASYGQALTLLGQVIALHATAIARERSRPRPDRELIARMERHRHEAVELCRRLTSRDPDQLDWVVREYSSVYDTLLAMTRH